MNTCLRLLVCLAVGSLAHAQTEKPRARTYTNEDLDRVHVQRAETGASSEIEQPPRADAARDPRAAHGEEYWRREAEREERRLEPLRRRLEELERKLAEHRSKPATRRKGSFEAPPDAAIPQLQAQIESLRARIREQEGRFLDRARREGALPGWLRR